MNSIVERLRRLSADGNTGYGMPIAGEAADLIEAQEQRIKELEAENVEHRRLHRQSEEVIRALHREATEYKTELAALHQRIADAPVVAWRIVSEIPTATDYEMVFDYFEFPIDGGVPLISKEDLQK